MEEGDEWEREGEEGGRRGGIKKAGKGKETFSTAVILV